MQPSLGLRALIVGVLTVVMGLPALFVADVINERADYNRQTASQLGTEWGGGQTLIGPVMVLPVRETVTEENRYPVLDPESGVQERDANDLLVFEYRTETRFEDRAPIYVMPNAFEAGIDAATQIRARGIFEVPVYTADLTARFDFDLAGVGDDLTTSHEVLWQEAHLIVGVSANRGLRGAARVQAPDGSALPVGPLGARPGLQIDLGDPRAAGTYEMTLGLFGADRLHIAPVGRLNVVDMISDWPDPSFRGAFLPNTRDVTEDGFSARWEVPHVARTVPQVSRTSPLDALEAEAAFGVHLYQPNDFYQKSFRAARYGVLFIGLTFLAIFLADRDRTPPAHPVQYALVGLSQLVFFLLMVSLSEQVGFALAYFISAAMTVALITVFAFTAMRMGWRSLWLGLGLVALYALLYLVLLSADYAFLIGSALSFIAVAATMWATRHESWQGEGRGILTFLLTDPSPNAH